MASNSTISIGFKIEDKGNGVKELILNGKNLKEVMRANVEVAQKFNKTIVNFSALTTLLKNAADSAQGLCDKMRELGSVQRENIATAQLTGLMGEELRELRDSAKSVAEYFGKDYMEVLQSVNSVSKGFGVSAEEAMRMIKDGMISGADANGEFLDTLREYPRYFKEAGLSAEEFIAITTNAAQQGIYSDKGVDTIKEGNLRIREMTKATAEALDAIGISSQGVQEALKNGSVTTFEVMQQVAQKLKELPPSATEVGTAIADIFGGPGEDAGLEYIKSLANIELNMGRVKEASGELAAQQEKQINATEELKNRFSWLTDAVSNFAAKNSVLIEFGTSAIVSASSVATLISAVKALNIQQAIMRARTLASNAALVLFDWTMKGNAKSTRMLSNAFNLTTKSATTLKIALRGVFITSGIGAAIMGITWLIEKLVNKADDATDAMGKLGEGQSDVTKDLSDAQRKLKESTEEMSRYIVICGTFKGTVEEERKILGELNERYSETLGSHKSLAEWKDVLTKNFDKYIQKLTLEAEAQDVINSLVQQNIHLRNLQNDLARLNPQDPFYEAQKRQLKGMITLQSDLYSQTKEKLAKIQAEAKNIKFGDERTKSKGVSKTESATKTKTPTKTAQEIVPEGSIKDLENRISALKGKIDLSTDTDEIVKLNGQIAELQSKIKAIELEVKVKGESGDWMKKIADSEEMKGALKVTPDDIKLPDAINDTKKSWADKEREKAEKLNSTFCATADIVGNVGSAFSSMGEATGKGGFKIAGVIAQTVANLLASFGQMMANPITSAGGPVTWIASGISGLAQVAAMIAQVKQLAAQPFANGGIVSGPTYALVGEYAGARNNPEVIAPLNKLRDLIGTRDSENGGRVTFRIEGRTLVGLLEKETRLNARR